MSRGGWVPEDGPADELAGGRLRESSRPRATDGIAELFARDYLGLLRLATLLTGDSVWAEDIVADAFLALHRRWRFVRDEHAYLRTAVVNGSRSALRRRRTARSYQPPGLADLPSAEESALAAAGHAEVLRAVAALPTRWREVVVLRYWLDLSEAEIAATLGIAPGTVKAYASRARSALAAQLEGEA